MEEGKTVLTDYEPFDISNIKQIRIFNEKELETEAISICESLKDISNESPILMF
jgi:hypothetical protein